MWDNFVCKFLFSKKKKENDRRIFSFCNEDNVDASREQRWPKEDIQFGSQTLSRFFWDLAKTTEEISALICENDEDDDCCC